MKTHLIKNPNSTNPLETIKESILLNDFEKARTLLSTVLGLNIENPQVYNLLGICYEKEGLRQQASKFYRVSYYMDQTYFAPSNNLSRTSEFSYRGFKNVDWGLNDLGGSKI